MLLKKYHQVNLAIIEREAEMTEYKAESPSLGNEFVRRESLVIGTKEELDEILAGNQSEELVALEQDMNMISQMFRDQKEGYALESIEISADDTVHTSEIIVRDLKQAKVHNDNHLKKVLFILFLALAITGVILVRIFV